MAKIAGTRKQESTDWYREEAGFFGPEYLREYTHIIPEERTLREVDFLEKSLGRFGFSRQKRVLDLCCGHGRHTLEFIRRGYAVTGFDLNTFFLKEAREKALQGGLSAPLVKGDMRAIPFSRQTFDVVVNLFTAFGYFQTDEEHERVIKEAARVLAPHGLFVLDVMNREWLVRKYIDKDWSEFEDGFILMRERHFDIITGVHQETRTRIFPDGRREKTCILLRVYALTELIAMVQSAGLRVVDLYGDFDGNPIGLDSPRAVLIAQKQ